MAAGTAQREKPLDQTPNACSENHIYLSLAPKADLGRENNKRFRFYCELLEDIFQNTELRNIALIGNRGSGKSSIIRSFDTTKQNPSLSPETTNGNSTEGTDTSKNRRKFLYISLTDFADSNKAEKADPAEIRRKLEYSLLCQILSRCDENDLKNSSIKGIPLDQIRLRPLRYTWFCITMLLVVGLIFENRFGALLAGLGVPTLWRVGIHAAGYILAFFLIIVGFLYYRRKRPETMKIKRLVLKAKDLEAEITPSSNTYCLDQYRFEIVHILDQIARKIDHTVVIEDMERCGNSDVAREIMTRLRELNALVNTHRKVKNQASHKKKDPHTPIRFIYALSDDLFENEERIKFFDTIIPVIPFIHSTNVVEQLKKELCIDSDTKKTPMTALIGAIAPHLINYRSMRNVVTEFKILKKYHRSVCDTEQHDDPFLDVYLLTLAAYKGLCPKDYHDKVKNGAMILSPLYSCVECHSNLSEDQLSDAISKCDCQMKTQSLEKGLQDLLAKFHI